MNRYAITVFSVWGAEVPADQAKNEDQLRRLLPMPTVHEVVTDLPTTLPKVTKIAIYGEDDNLPATATAYYEWITFVEAESEDEAADIWWASHDAYEWKYPSDNKLIVWSSDIIFGDMLVKQVPTLAELVEAVRWHAEDNYGSHEGWDILVETFEDSDIIKYVDKATSTSEAIKMAGEVVGTIHEVWQERMSPDAF